MAKEEIVSVLASTEKWIDCVEIVTIGNSLFENFPCQRAVTDSLRRLRKSKDIQYLKKSGKYFYHYKG